MPSGLAAYLNSVLPSEIFFVGHSLGCRVILETIVRLKVPTQRITISGFMLIAGAVPIHLLLESTAFFRQTRRAGRRYCLYSRLDGVLGIAFPPGQIAAGEIPPYGLPLATGFTGAPSGFYDLRNYTGLAHGGYWKKGIFRGRSSYADLFSQVLGVAADRELAESELMEMGESRRSREIPNRLITVRALMETIGSQTCTKTEYSARPRTQPQRHAKAVSGSARHGWRNWLRDVRRHFAFQSLPKSQPACYAQAQKVSRGLPIAPAACKFGQAAVLPITNGRT